MERGDLMKNITVFTSKTCQYCPRAKSYLTEKGYPFIEKDISDPSVRQELMKMGARGVPTFLIGDDMVVGFDPDKIEQLIDFVIVSCPNCKSKLRLPKNEKNIIVSCPKCNNEFKVIT